MSAARSSASDASPCSVSFALKRCAARSHISYGCTRQQGQSTRHTKHLLPSTAPLNPRASHSVSQFPFGSRQSVRRLEAPVDVPAVAHLHDDDDQLVVSNLVNDPPDPLAHSILIFCSSELLAARRSRVAGERQNPIHHGAPDLPGFDPLDFLGGRRLDAEAIVSHAASGTSRSPRNATPAQQHAPQTPQGLQRPQQVPSALHHSPSPRLYGHSLLTSASALGERPARSTPLRGGHRSWNQYGVTAP